jgi:hypothetical protein
MLRYLLLDGGIGILDGSHSNAVQKKLGIALPHDGTLYLNGRDYESDSGVAKIPASALREVNHVRFVSDRGSWQCEGFSWDGESVTPLGLDLRESIAALGREVCALRARCEEQAARLRELEKCNTGTLFD